MKKRVDADGLRTRRGTRRALLAFGGAEDVARGVFAKRVILSHAEERHVTMRTMILFSAFLNVLRKKYIQQSIQFHIHIYACLFKSYSIFLVPHAPSSLLPRQLDEEKEGQSTRDRADRNKEYSLWIGSYDLHVNHPVYRRANDL